jgi:hypothetical protein
VIAALSPFISWAVFLACIGVGAVVYIVVAGGRRYRRMAQQSFTLTQPEDAHIRIFGGPYDAVARGDFRHDPIRDHAYCDVCDALVRRAFNRLADRPGTPRDADELIAAIREELES